MAEEHGYQRSGKKCREKLENLYKYYKKTKEGKAGRHDGKHYRFFRQLEALYGDGNPNPMADSANLADYAIFHAFNAATSSQEQVQRQKIAENVSLSNSSGFESWSSEDDDNAAAVGCSDRRSGEADDADGSKRRRKSWRAKMREFVDQQLERFMAVQEAWLEKMVTTLETKEKERISRDEERRKREAASLEEEHRFWAKERAWIEARDVALVEALERLSGLEQKPPSPENEISLEAVEESDCENRRWTDREVTRLIQIRTTMEERFQGGFLKSALWEEISAKMGSSGYSRSAKRCKEKWENVNKYFRKTTKCSKKRKESSRACPYYKHLDSLYCGQGSDQSCQENRYDGEAAVAADQGNEERYVPFLVDGAATSFWAASFLDSGR